MIPKERERERGNRDGLSPGISIRPRIRLTSKIFLLVERVELFSLKFHGEKLGHSCCSKKATIRSGIPKTCARYIGFKVCPGCVARRVIERRLKRGKKGRGSGKRVLDNASFITAKGGVIECGGNYARKLDNL